MIYTAVFQNSAGDYRFETHVSVHDRGLAWHDIHDKREDKNTCLIMLIDGQANVKTFEQIVDKSS